MKNKDELLQEGYLYLGKYDEELCSYYKLSEANNIPGAIYYFVDQKGSIVGGEKFISKKDIGLVANLQAKIASKQRMKFAGMSKRAGKGNKVKMTK